MARDPAIPGGVETRIRLQRGRGPRPGVEEPPFDWPDLLDGAPPKPRAPGEGAYNVYHHAEVDERLRLRHSTVVRAVPPPGGGEPTLLVEGHLSVHSRALLDLLDRERAFSDRLAARLRQRLAASLRRQRRGLERLPRPLARAGSVLLRAESWAGLAFIRLLQGAGRTLAALPDELLTHLYEADARLATRLGRKSLWEGVRDPERLTLSERGVLLFLVAAGIIFLALALRVLIGVVLPGFAPAYGRMLADATLMMLGTVALPMVVEPFIVLSTLAVGPVGAFLAFFLGKLVGVWVVFVLGDSFHDALAAARGKGWLGKAMGIIERGANRPVGLVLLVLVNAIPLAPDLLLYAFAVSGMRFRSWMTGCLVGSGVRIAAVVGGVVLLGPDQVQVYLDMLPG